ncbi:MAG: hypothetical protein EOO73_24035 [Myxococcales bacterium]|nr:MAG: hypothetical protein EOO73_24035 [Myxococcales bacterium]
MTKRALSLLLLCLLMLVAARSRAETPEEGYAAALVALGKGADNEAIDRLELLADQGVVSADASLARAAAYLARADGTRAQPGDLGRAAAALNEALLLRPDDAKTEHALEEVQAEIARRRSKQDSSVVVRPRLTRALVGLLSEQAWAMLAAFSSLVVTLGLVARRITERPLPRLSGLVAIYVGALLLLLFGGAAYAAEQFRSTSQPAVVVVPEARLTNEAGRPLAAKRGAETTAVPEGATVYVRERREGRCLIEWGSTDGWVSLSDVRLLTAA